MGLLRRKRGYDRTRILAEAARARKRRKRRKAIQLYREVLAHEPENPDLLRRLAPLLAQTKQNAEAWETFHRAASRLAERGFAEQAIGVYREASRYLPHEVAVWKSLADLEVGRGRRPDAVGVLLQGRRHFRKKRWRDEAVQLLERARRIDPNGFDASFDLAGLLARSGARRRARRLLEELATRSHRRQLRRVRARLFLLFPSPRSAWGWIASLVRA